MSFSIAIAAPSTTGGPTRVGPASVDPASVGILAALAAAEVALSAVTTDPASYTRLSDSELVAASVTVGQERDTLGALAAVLAGEVARRSAPELGARGLAQRNGFRTPIEMVKATTRATGREAVQAVRTGTLLVEVSAEGNANPVTGEVGEVGEPWMKPVAAAIAAGQLSLGAVDAIRLGLGKPNSSVTIDLLTTAARQLVLVARTVDPDRLQRLARAARDEIDAAGIGAREDERRAARSLRLVVLPDGMGRLVWTMDPATLAIVKNAYDRATSPKLGGPRLGGVRFEAKSGHGSAGRSAKAKHDEILADVRTAEQLASDAFAHLVSAGADADPSVLIGTGAPVVKLVARVAAVAEAASVTMDEGARAAQDRAGFGFLEGHADPVGIGTIQHAMCTGTTEVIVFDERGRPLEFGSQAPQKATLNTGATVDADDRSSSTSEGREHRLFTPRQRSRLAARDGGCRWPGCNRPPSWSEAHHIRWWAKEHGATVLQNGILLCKHHHLLLHNDGWEIEVRSDPATGVDRYWLIPPAQVDSDRTPRAMPSTSPIWNQEFDAAS